jgi:hypothetical protein
MKYFVFCSVTNDLASSLLGHDQQLRRALTVVVPCAVLPLFIALILVAVRRCRRHQGQQQQQRRAPAGTSVKEASRVVSVGNGNAQHVAHGYAQQQQAQVLYLSSFEPFATSFY